jgi:hypothetical protein
VFVLQREHNRTSITVAQVRKLMFLFYEGGAPFTRTRMHAARAQCIGAFTLQEDVIKVNTKNPKKLPLIEKT